MRAGCVRACLLAGMVLALITGAAPAAGAAGTRAGAVSQAPWQVQRTAIPVIGSGRLTGVSCTSPGACTAVGFYANTPGDGTLAEAWDGTSWSIQATPSPSATRATLFGVSCTSAASCTAVGAAQQAPDRQAPLAEVWHGTSWSLQRTPSPDAGGSLSAVSCASASSCTAVGTVAEGWNGTSWLVQHSPGPGPGNSQLAAVSCVSAVACTAAGAYDNASGSHGLAESWNGSTWSVRRFPSPPGTGTMVTVSGVSCTSAVACTAVGFYIGGGAGHMLAAAWNGTAWSLQRAAVPAGSPAGLFHGVACGPAGPCRAVGSYTNSVGTSLALAEARAQGPVLSVR